MMIRLPRGVRVALVLLLALLLPVPALVAADEPGGIDAGPNPALYVVNADGTNPTRLLADRKLSYWGPAWSHDGSRIVVSASIPNGTESELVLVDVAHPGVSTPLTHNGRSANYYLAWSPDDQTIAFISRQGEGTATDEVYTVRVGAAGTGGDQEQRLTNDDGWAYGVTWSPDGRQIAFGAELGGRWQLYLVDAAGGPPRPLTTEAQGNAPTWSPDGRQIAFTSDREGNDDIWVTNPDGTGQRNLTHNPAWDDEPFWSPDGRHIAFVSDRDGGRNLYVMDSNGGNVTNVTNRHDLDVGMPSWSPDGRQLAFHASRVDTGLGAVLKENTPLAAALAGGLVLLGGGSAVVWRRARRRRRISA